METNLGNVLICTEMQHIEHSTEKHEKILAIKV